MYNWCIRLCNTVKTNSFIAVLRIDISHWVLLTCAAQSIWETGSQETNPSDFTTALQNSDLCQFAEESFMFDLWGAISDAKQGRLKKVQEFEEQF